MKIAITGHTSGIGLEIYNYFQNQGHECIGFSRSNGFDIAEKEARHEIVKQSVDCDIFVNNAYSDFDSCQLYVLQLMYHAWQGVDKTIINISSRVTDFRMQPGNPAFNYSLTKQQLDQFCLGKVSKPYVCNLKLGMTDTPRVKNFEVPKMKTELLVDMLDFILHNKDKFKVTTLTAGL